MKSSPLSSLKKNLALRMAGVVAINLIPVAGVLFWGWSLFHIALLLWFEVFAIGVFEVLGVLIKNPDRKELNGIRSDRSAARSSTASLWHGFREIILHLKSRLIGFVVMTLVFGLISAMYGMAIVHYLSDEKLDVPERLTSQPMVAGIYGILNYIFSHGLRWAALAFLVGYVIQLITDTYRAWKAGCTILEKRENSVFLLKALVMHLSLAVVAFAIAAFGNPTPAVLFLLAVKIGVELLLCYLDAD